ncbi:Hypothetical predicted protein [Cloeon dipterum]|uniref:MBD domain-containing protein n=1 Tax=Cloeon dipterum TaxID=197152 RepID=A0A8S1C4J0_9INSE|nr:Hypothetical predicted protein [Cloeon dipterum]
MSRRLRLSQQLIHFIAVGFSRSLHITKKWRKLVTRNRGITKGEVDVYVFSPDGTRFRSKVELRDYLRDYKGGMPNVEEAFKKPAYARRHKLIKSGTLRKNLEQMQLVFKGEDTYQLANHKGKKLSTKQVDKLAGEVGWGIAKVKLKLMDSSNLASKDRTAIKQEVSASCAVEKGMRQDGVKKEVANNSHAEIPKLGNAGLQLKRLHGTEDPSVGFWNLDQVVKKETKEFSLTETGFMTQEELDALLAHRNNFEMGEDISSGSANDTSHQSEIADETENEAGKLETEQLEKTEEEGTANAEQLVTKSKNEPSKKIRRASIDHSKCDFRYNSPLEIKEVISEDDESKPDKVKRKIDVFRVTDAKEKSASDLLTSYLYNQEYLQVKGKSKITNADIRKEDKDKKKAEWNMRDEPTPKERRKFGCRLGYRSRSGHNSSQVSAEVADTNDGKSRKLKHGSSQNLVSKKHDDPKVDNDRVVQNGKFHPSSKSDHTKLAQEEGLKKQVGVGAGKKSGRSRSEDHKTKARPNTPKTRVKVEGGTERHFLDIQIQIPLKSPFNLIYESLATQPWKVIVSSYLVSRLNASKGYCIVLKFFDEFSSLDEMENVEALLNFFTGKRTIPVAERVAQELRLIAETLKDKSVTSLMDVPCIEKYTIEVFQIFCVGDWTKIQPESYDLECYVEWRRQQQLTVCFRTPLESGSFKEGSKKYIHFGLEKVHSYDG